MDLDIYRVLEQVRRQSPVVHHLTNWVTIYDCAQVVKTLGASPVMAHAPEEVSEMARIASALVLNIGTLTSELVEAMKLALKSANHKGIPVVLDVCGAGATALRDQKSFELLAAGRIDVLKGNASEIARIAGEPVHTRGVDAAETSANLAKLAQALAQKHTNVVVVTGKQDIVTDGRRTFFVDNGHELMTRIVGTGCMAASVIGAFTAVEPDLVKAATSALACYGLAAEIAAEKATGPLNFKERLFDTLANLDRQTCISLAKLVEL
jgi:hydroxyethylthiazole kinase